jgi:hypothetical protein
MESGPPTNALRMIPRKPSIFARPAEFTHQSPIGTPASGRSACLSVLRGMVVHGWNCSPLGRSRDY